MTVKQLIDKLNNCPQDLPITIFYDIGPKTKDDPDYIHIVRRVWTPQNYPYDRDDFDYISLE